MRTEAMPEPVTVACCQLRLRIGDLDGNRAEAAAAVAEAAAGGAGIVVLPELTPSGYVFADVAEARSLAEPADGPTAAEWTALAAAHGVVIVGGFAEIGDDGLLYNTAMLVDAGGVRAVYRKAHLWDAEADVFTPGTEPPPVVETRYGRISMVICYDAEFPEWVRLPALAGADLLTVPTNWPFEPFPPGERPLVTVNIQAAAYANRMFVAAACRCGIERGVGWTGGSVIAGPDGYPLAGPASVAGPSGDAEPELLLAACDLGRARDKASGPRNDAHADRRPDLYDRYLRTSPAGAAG
ncbi:MAG: nitrilase-related carbon-nitrogen hydrolase [Streptosporangiaceae bacterium]